MPCSLPLCPIRRMLVPAYKFRVFSDFRMDVQNCRRTESWLVLVPLTLEFGYGCTKRTKVLLHQTRHLTVRPCPMKAGTLVPTSPCRKPRNTMPATASQLYRLSI